MPQLNKKYAASENGTQMQRFFHVPFAELSRYAFFEIVYIELRIVPAQTLSNIF